MHLFGLVALGYMWCRIAAAAREKIAADRSRHGCDAKLVTARFFMERMLPETGDASRPHRGRRRQHDGNAGGDVLIGVAFLTPSSAIGNGYGYMNDGVVVR